MHLSITFWSAIGAFISVTQATQYHIDCFESSGGPGTLGNPWNSLAQANQHTFQPGDIIALKAGTVCNGVLSPKGVGTATAPIQITKYGGDADADAVINGTGTAGAAVTLTNQDHWHIANLTVTNPARQLAARQGIHVTANDGKTHAGITISGNAVHHVAGETNKAGRTTAAFVLSAGILVDVGAAPGSRYDDVLVRGNAVSDCGGGGIKVRVGNAFSHRGARARVTGNAVRACGGDGIVLSYGDAPLVDGNVAADLGRGAYPWSGGNFAGMWVLGGRDPTIRGNVVVGSAMSAFDSQAFDCDWGNAGTCTVEYNLSRDNAGGAFLNCDGCGPSGGGVRQVVRYNVFQNDCRFYSNGDRPTLDFYQNVLYCDKASFNMTLPRNTNFTNNIIVGNGKSALPTRSGIGWHQNVFQNVNAPTGGGIKGDPRFVNPGSASDTLESAAGYRLRSGSPALRAGQVIPNNGGVDFFGNSVPKSSKPNIGVYNGPGL